MEDNVRDALIQGINLLDTIAAATQETLSALVAVRAAHPGGWPPRETPDGFAGLAAAMLAGGPTGYTPDEPAAPAPVRYAIPGPPPMGRRVRTMRPDIVTYTAPGVGTHTPADQWVFLHVDDDDWAPDYIPPDQWEASTPDTFTWIYLLTRFAPLELVPLTDEELAAERLYGPVGARWGNPNVVCPHELCILGTGHVGLHKDFSGHLIEPDLTAEVVQLPKDAYCDCGHPEAHRPGCPRRVS